MKILLREWDAFQLSCCTVCLTPWQPVYTGSKFLPLPNTRFIFLQIFPDTEMNSVYMLMAFSVNSTNRAGGQFKFSSVGQLCPTLCNPMKHSTPGLPLHHQLTEFTQTCVHWVGNAIQPSHPLSSPSPPALSLSQNHGLFKWVSSSHQVAKVLEFQLQHQSFQWTPRTDLF